MIKHKPKHKKISKNVLELQKLILENGVNSDTVFKYMRPFIIKVVNQFMHKYIRESIEYETYDEVIITDCWLRILRAFEGYYKYNKKTKKEEFIPPYFNPESCNNIGNFIFTICRNEVTKYLYHKNKRNLELDVDDCSDKESYQNFFNCKEVEKQYITLDFKNVSICPNFKNHIMRLGLEKPINNVFYTFILEELYKC